jgi:hypothetical protein
MVGLHIVEGL